MFGFASFTKQGRHQSKGSSLTPVSEWGTGLMAAEAMVVVRGRKEEILSSKMLQWKAIAETESTDANVSVNESPGIK